MPKSDSQLLREIHGTVCSLETAMTFHLDTQKEHGTRISSLEKKAWYERGIFVAVGGIVSLFFRSKYGG